MNRTVYNALKDMSLAFPRQEIPPETIKVYMEHLSDLPEPVVLKAIRQAIGSCTFFPSIAELRELAAGQAQGAGDIAELAWTEVQREARRVGYQPNKVFHNGEFHDPPQPRFSSPLIAEAVESMGWKLICQGDNSKGAIREDFIFTFKAIAARQTNQIKRGDFRDISTDPALPEAPVRAIGKGVA